jgi:hypothetical protein
MKIIIVVLCAIALVGCSAPKSKSTALTDGSTAYTVSCASGWGECYRLATKICGSTEFTELDRMADGSVSSAGHLARRHSVEGGIDDHVYSENPRKEIFDRVLTFGCNSPDE